MNRYHVRSIRNTALVLALAAGLAGCSDSQSFTTRPSPVPSSLAAHGGTTGNARYYSATISPTSVAAGTATTTFVVTITNCNGAGTCDGVHVSDNSSKIKSATVAVPAGFVVDPTSLALSANVSGWTKTLVAGVISVAKVGNQDVARGESFTITFDAVAPCTAGAYPWNTIAYQDDDFDNAFVIVGAQPSVEVTGSCTSGCTLTQGYWKTHGPSPTGNNLNEWPVTTLTLGTRSYTDLELQSILDAPVAGNGLIQLAHQLIAAKLNIANGADGSAITTTIAAADTLIGSLVIPPVGSDSLPTADTSALTSLLDDYNKGVTGPGHCGG